MIDNLFQNSLGGKDQEVKEIVLVDIHAKSLVGAIF